MVETMSGYIILDCQIKTHNYGVAEVEFFWEINFELAQLKKEYADVLHAEIGHPLK